VAPHFSLSVHGPVDLPRRRDHVAAKSADDAESSCDGYDRLRKDISSPLIIPCYPFATKKSSTRGEVGVKCAAAGEIHSRAVVRPVEVHRNLPQVLGEACEAALLVIVRRFCSNSSLSYRTPLAVAKAVYDESWGKYMFTAFILLRASSRASRIRALRMVLSFGMFEPWRRRAR
jgi:hypothetical protein